MAVTAPFTTTGNTVTFLANTSAPSAVQAISTTLGGNQYRVVNAGTVVAFLGFGQSQSAAQNNAVVVSTTAISLPMLPGTDEIITFTPNAWFTAITSSGTAQIYITPGDGN